MTFFRGTGLSSAINNETASSGAMSQINPLQELSTFSTSRGLSDGFSLDDVFSVMLKDLEELADKVTAFETEYLHTQEKSAKSRRRRESSQSALENKYQEILNSKENFVEGLTQAVDETNVSPDIPKSKIHCYQQLAAIFQEKYNETKEDIEIRMEELKELEKEYSTLELQVETFKKVKGEVENVNEEDEPRLLFQEAKADLMTLLSVLYSKNVKKEFMEAMSQLIEAYTSNLDNEENQYVEFSPEVSINEGICALKKGFVVVEHPTNSAKIRFNLKE